MCCCKPDKEVKKEFTACSALPYCDAPQCWSAGFWHPQISVAFSSRQSCQPKRCLSQKGAKLAIECLQIATLQSCLQANGMLMLESKLYVGPYIPRERVGINAEGETTGPTRPATTRILQRPSAAAQAGEPSNPQAPVQPSQHTTAATQLGVDWLLSAGMTQFVS